MSKQGSLLDLDSLTNWRAVYDAASATDQRIYDYVAAHPGCFKRDLVAALGISAKSLDFRLWELAGRSTGGHRADGLLIASVHTPYRYTARPL